MKVIKWIVVALLVPLLAVQSYTPTTLHHDLKDMADADDNGAIDSLEQYNTSRRYTLTPDGDGIEITMPLPDSFGTYAEVFGCTNLPSGQWSVVDSWIPTYGTSVLILDVAVRTNVNTFFYMINDATTDCDGDGYSDWRERYISLTDPEFFDDADEDGDGMHDFWEIKLFGDIWTQDGYDDSDGDGLPNNQELVWLAVNTIRMYSDPSLCDTDGEGLDDGAEQQKQTDPLSADTDADGRNDASEVLGSPPTDPNNPDIVAPILVLAGG